MCSGEKGVALTGDELLTYGIQRSREFRVKAGENGGKEEVKSVFLSVTTSRWSESLVAEFSPPDILINLEGAMK